MKLRFDPDQPHQRAAIDAVLDVLGLPSWPRPVGIGSALVPDAAPLRAGLHAVQDRGGLPRTEPSEDAEGPPQLSIEMETGTGKTYAYLRTLLALAQRHGLRKHVIVVPSVAIREGVLQTLRATAEHFAALHPGLAYRFFAYDGARLGRLRSFARSAEVELMVLTLDAFNKARNRMRRPHDGFGGAPPLELLQAVRPVVVLDEPQRMESPRSREALRDLGACLVLRYSATHRRRHALVHRLTPRQAHAQGLVKRIEVDAAGAGIADRDTRMAAQVEATVRHHLERQAALLPRGIKVLSLLFVERVDDWVAADGPVRRALAQAYARHAPAHPRFAAWPVERVCAAYFAERTRGGQRRAIDSRTGRSAADEEAYALIMRDKERLLSLDEPVGFIVSHSALREGWDNPNVFQICTLARSRSTIKKRQEIGRGVRLCVDQSGRRVFDPEVDVLTVIANDSYEDYVAGLQAEDAEHLEADELAPAPARAGQGTVTSPAAVSPARPPWRRIDTARLRADAIAEARRQGAPPGPPEGAVLDDPLAVLTERLLGRRPPCLVSHVTLEAVLAVWPGPASWWQIDRAAAAIVHALRLQLPSSDLP